ncbi:MAG: MFS transporter [Candidatus Limnocylindria bacterium]
MMRSLASAATALRQVFANPDIRRAQLAWMTGWAAEWAWLVALLVYAHAAGGVLAVGLLGLARTLPAAILAPALSTLTDRLPRHRVLLGVHAGRATLIGLAAWSALAGWSPLVVFAIAPLDGLLAVLHRPTHMSLMPALARAPEELVAGNVASSTLEAIGTLVGPAIGGGLVATGLTSLTFAVPASAFALAALAVAGVRPAQGVRVDRGRPGPVGLLLGGVSTLADHPHAALLLGLFGLQTLVRGSLSVLLVVAAVELLAIGEQGVGYLNATLGAGGFAGALAAMSLVGRRRLAPPVFLGLVLWGVPIVAMGLLPAVGVALLALATVGAGNAVLDVAGFSLLQRSVPNAVRGRVFGVLEAIAMLTVGLGSAAAPLLVAAFGVRGALIATGLLLPVAAVLAWPQVRRADERAVIPARELALLRGVPMFGLLPLTVLEQVAGDVVASSFAPGTTIIRQGEGGDRFYVLAGGEAVASVDGTQVRRMRAGDWFGEIALLRDVPRTATVTAATVVHVLALEREAFVAAVTGDRASTRAAEGVIEERLSVSRPETRAPPR